MSSMHNLPNRTLFTQFLTECLDDLDYESIAPGDLAEAIVGFMTEAGILLPRGSWPSHRMNAQGAYGQARIKR